MSLEDKFKNAKVDDRLFKDLSRFQKRCNYIIAKVWVLFSRIKRKINRSPKDIRWYLKTLDIKKEDIPYYYGRKNDKREKDWKRQRKKYGFDERETWSIEATFFVWLYERLSMYSEVNCIATEKDEYEVNGETRTFQYWIDKMLENCKCVIEQGCDDKDYYHKADEILSIFSELIYALWW